MAVSTKTVAEMEAGIVHAHDLSVLKTPSEIARNTGFKNNRVAVLGTSLVQQGNLSSTSSTYCSTRSWFHWASFFLNGRVDIPVWYDPTIVTGWEPGEVGGTTRNFWGLNFGVSGQFIATVWARRERVLSDLKKSQTGIIIIDVGTNDMAGQTADYITTERHKLYDYFANAGITVVALPILARDESQWSTASGYRQKANLVNRNLREYARTKPNVVVFDWNKYWLDYNNATGEVRTGYSYDGTHIQYQGAFSIGKGLAEVLDRLVPNEDSVYVSPDDALDVTNNLYGNLWSNPYMQGTAGTVGTGVTGTVCDGIRCERSGTGTATAVASIEPRTDGLGNWQVLSITGNAETNESLFYTRTNPSTVGADASLVGKFVRMHCDVELSAHTEWTDIAVYIRDEGGTGDTVECFRWTEGDSPNEVIKGRLTTPWMRIDANTGVRLRIQIGFKGTASGATVKMGAIVTETIDDPRTTYGIGHTDGGVEI